MWSLSKFFEEFDDEAYIAAVREDGRNEGRAEGREERRAEGIQEGKIAERNRIICSIYRVLLSEGMPAPAASARIAQLLGLPVSEVCQALESITDA